MSRHALTPLPAYAQHTIMVGWDQPLRTYYVQVVNHNATDEPDDDTPAHEDGSNPNIWLGCAEGEITDASDVAEIVRQYAEIPHGLVAQLKAEQAAEPGQGAQVWQMCITDEHGNHL